MKKMMINGNDFFSWNPKEDFQDRYESVSFFFDPKSNALQNLNKFDKKIFLTQEFWDKLFNEHNNEEKYYRVLSKISPEDTSTLIENLDIDFIKNHDWTQFAQEIKRAYFVAVTDKIFKEKVAQKHKFNAQQIIAEHPHLLKIITIYQCSRYKEVLTDTADKSESYLDHVKSLIEGYPSFPPYGDMTAQAAFIEYLLPEGYLEKNPVTAFKKISNPIINKKTLDFLSEENKAYIYSTLTEKNADVLNYFLAKHNLSYTNFFNYILFDLEAPTSRYNSYVSEDHRPLEVIYKDKLFKEYLSKKGLLNILKNSNTLVLSKLIPVLYKQDYIEIKKEEIPEFLNIIKPHLQLNHSYISTLPKMLNALPEEWRLSHYWHPLITKSTCLSHFKLLHKFTGIAFDKDFLKKAIEEGLNEILDYCFSYKSNLKNKELVLEYAKSLYKLKKYISPSKMQECPLRHDREFMEDMEKISCLYGEYYTEKPIKQRQPRAKI